MAMKENSRKVFEYVKEHGAEDITAKDVAEALGLSPATVNGCFTSSIQKKDLGYRVPAEVELEDGTHQAVKFLKLNDNGFAFNPDEEADA